MKCPKCGGEVPLLKGATRKGVPYYKCASCGASLVWRGEGKAFTFGLPVLLVVTFVLGFFPAWFAVPVALVVLVLVLKKTFVLEPEENV